MAQWSDSEALPGQFSPRHSRLRRCLPPLHVAVQVDHEDQLSHSPKGRSLSFHQKTLRSEAAKLTDAGRQRTTFHFGAVTHTAPGGTRTHPRAPLHPVPARGCARGPGHPELPLRN